MNFEHIDFFMTCAACLNFSLAAKYQFISVSTLSRSITALEEELGVKLFERGYHGHELTDAGREFFEYCVKCSMDLNNYLMHWSKHEKDILRIGCSTGNSSYEKLINACAKMPADYIPKNIKVTFIEVEDIRFALQSGYIDVIVLDYEITKGVDGVKTSFLYSENGNDYVFAARADFDDLLLAKLGSLKKFIK